MYAHVCHSDESLRVSFVEVGSIVNVMKFLLDHRLVVLDVHKNRYLPRPSEGMQSIGMIQRVKTSMGHTIFRLDRTELDPSKVAYIGVEQIVRKQDKPQDAN